MRTSAYCSIIVMIRSLFSTYHVFVLYKNRYISYTLISDMYLSCLQGSGCWNRCIFSCGQSCSIRLYILDSGKNFSRNQNVNFSILIINKIGFDNDTFILSKARWQVNSKDFTINTYKFEKGCPLSSLPGIGLSLYKNIKSEQQIIKKIYKQFIPTIESICCLILSSNFPYFIHSFINSNGSLLYEIGQWQIYSVYLRTGSKNS